MASSKQPTPRQLAYLDELKARLRELRMRQVTFMEQTAQILSRMSSATMEEAAAAVAVAAAAASVAAKSSSITLKSSDTASSGAVAGSGGKLNIKQLIQRFEDLRKTSQVGLNENPSGAAHKEPSKSLLRQNKHSLLVRINNPATGTRSARGSRRADQRGRAPHPEGLRETDRGRQRAPAVLVSAEEVDGELCPFGRRQLKSENYGCHRGHIFRKDGLRQHHGIYGCCRGVPPAGSKSHPTRRQQVPAIQLGHQ